MAADQPTDVVITADAHVGEPDALRERLPERFRARLPELTVNGDGNLIFKVNGEVVEGPPERKPTAEDLLREFRSDPSQGTDLERRLYDMALEGIDAQVIFPNIGLGCSMGDESAAFYQAWARAHNDLVWELFKPHHQRFKPAAIIPIDDIEAAVDEAERCTERGFCTLFLPAVVPWQPYWMPVYEPLWSFAEEAGIPLNFHTFSGNLGLRADFASPGDLDQDRYEKTRKVAVEEISGDELLGTVLGLAAGMSPIVNLTGAGVLERHPNLRFVVTESECGWLAWLLQAMDQMQERRYLAMRELSLKASDYFKRQGAITISDDPVALHNVELTGSDCLVWGNDYPHDEGTFPHSRRPIEEIRDRLGPDNARKVLCGNAARLYGFDLDHLAAHRDEVTRHRH